jgi:hypothetical protein
MAYIGTKPTIGNFQICDAISVVNGQAAYSMQVGGVNVSPQSANHMIVSLNGVIQKPNSSYTVANSVITFSSNLATGDIIDFIQILGDVLDLGVPSDATVTTAKLADSSVSLAKLTATGTKDATTFLRGDNSFQAVPSGLGMADQWRVTQDMTNSDLSSGVVHQYLERCDSTGYSVLGTGMTESSGIFTFPSTGYYLITFSSTHSGPRDDGFITSRIDVTTDNSSYTTVSEATDNNGAGSGTNAGAFMQTQFLFDVTDTSTHKCRFQYTSLNSGTIINGSSTINKTNMFFMKLGDT